jgi:hypothetical protein
MCIPLRLMLRMIAFRSYVSHQADRKELAWLVLTLPSRANGLGPIIGDVVYRALESRFHTMLNPTQHTTRRMPFLSA